MTTLHVYFALRNQQAFQRLLDASRTANTQNSSSTALSTSGGRSWNKPSPLSGGGPPGAPLDVNAHDWLGRTVLHLAVSALDPAALEFVKLLLAHPKIDVNIPDLESRWTPLHRALYVGNIPACVLLLQRLDINVSLKDFEGYTAFDVYNSTVEGTKPGGCEATDLYTWGTNRNAALGVGDGDDRAFPEHIPIPPQREPENASGLSLKACFQPIRARKVAMAKLHTAVITSEPHANLRICGFGSGGRLGSGSAQHTQYAFSTPKDLNAEAQIVSIALAQDHTLALMNTGCVFSWGLNRFSQLGYALDGGQSLQTSPRRIVGPLKKEVVIGIAACRTASACWTANELFTWGANNGQLGHDRKSTPVQVLPRRVTQVTLVVVDVALSDVAMTVLLSSRDVHCFYNGRSFKLNFPSQMFPSEIQVYRPPMAQHNASIAKVVCCENTFAALSLNGEVFTFSLNPPPPVAIADATTVTTVKPQRIWALRKQFSAVKDVALGPEGIILLCTESGHVYLRSKTNKTSKFVLVPLVQRVVSVAASNAGAFAVLKAECAPAPICIEGNSVAQDLEIVQPYLLPREEEEWQTEPGSAGSDSTATSGGQPEFQRLSQEDADAEPQDDSDETSIKKDVKMIFRLISLLTRDILRRKEEGRGVFDDTQLRHGADLFVKVDSGFEFPVHRLILATRARVLKDVILGQTVSDSSSKLRCHFVDKFKLPHPTLMMSGVHPLSVLMLAVYLYTDEIPAIWDRRVTLVVSGKLMECVPKANSMDIRADLRRLATLLQLPALYDALDAPVKRIPVPRLAGDMKLLLDSVSRETTSFLGSSAAHPLVPDTVLDVEDAQLCCHSTVLRARSPFFDSLFGDSEWTVKRWQPDRPLVVNLKHMSLRVMDFVMRFIYSGGDEGLFDVLEFAQSPDDVLEFLFSVMDVAGELLLDRLLLVCSSVILQFLSINNACSIFSGAAFFNARQLSASVQGYLARNLETLLESHMLDELPLHLVRQLAEFVRAQQAGKLPVTRSGKLIDQAFEHWKDWLELQDISQPILPTRKTAGQIRQSPKLSPEVGGSPAKGKRRLSLIQLSASCSPPRDRIPITPPSVPIQDHVRTGSDEVFEMDDARDEIPPLVLPASQASVPSSAPRPGRPSEVGTYSPWKARVSQLPASKLDLRSIMAEAESQKAAFSTSTTPPGHSRVVGFETVAPGSPRRAPQKRDVQTSSQLKPGPSLPWRVPRPDSGLNITPAVDNPTIQRTSSGTQQSPLPSGLTRDLKENRLASGRPVLQSSRSSTQSTLAALSKGKATLGPTFTPTRQPLSVGAVPMRRNVSEGTSTKAWSTNPSLSTSAPKQADMEGPSNAPMSFLAIQQQQRDQSTGPVRVKKSLLEIQEEEKARAEEERALQEEVEFMRWWAAEEERIRRETQAQPGPPIAGPGVGDSGQRSGKKKKGGGPRKPSRQTGKKAVQKDTQASDMPAVGGEPNRAADGQKHGRRRRGKPKAGDTSITDS